MSGSKMREALESLVKFHRNYFGLDGAWDEEIIKAEYLLAQQRAAVVELTDEEIAKIGCSAEQATECEGYENNTLWFNGNLTDFARAVIAAHEKKQGRGQS